MSSFLFWQGVARREAESDFAEFDDSAGAGAEGAAGAGTGGKEVAGGGGSGGSGEGLDEDGAGDDDAAAAPGAAAAVGEVGAPGAPGVAEECDKATAAEEEARLEAEFAAWQSKVGPIRVRGPAERDGSNQRRRLPHTCPLSWQGTGGDTLFRHFHRIKSCPSLVATAAGGA